MAKGGTSGAVSFPVYIMEAHQRMMFGSVGGTGAILPSFTGIMQSAMTLYGGNPFTLAAFTDPTATLAALRTRYTTLLTEVAAADYVTQYLTSATDVMNAAQASVTGANLATITTGADSRATTEITAILAKGLTSGTDAATAWATIKARIEADVPNMVGLLDKQFNGAGPLSTGQAFITQALLMQDNSIAGISDWGNIIDAVVSRVSDLLSLNPNIDLNALFAAASARASGVVRDSIAAAVEAIDQELLDPVIYHFERRAQPQRAKIVRGYKAGMADLGAVNTSGYAMGLAVLHNQHTQESADFQAQMTFQLQNAALSLLSTTISARMQEALRAAEIGSGGRNSIISQSVQSLVSLLEAKAQATGALRGLFGQVYGVNATAQTQFGVQQLAGASQSIGLVAQSMTQLRSQKEQYEQATAQMYQQLMLGQLDVAMKAELARMSDVSSRSQTMLQATAALQQERRAQKIGVLTSFTEFERLAQTMTVEHEGAEIDLNEKAVMWDITLFTHYANILGAPSGMAAPLPGRASRGATALGGAMAGAGMGAAAGATIGGPLGAGIGAGIGGVIGLIGGLL